MRVFSCLSAAVDSFDVLSVPFDTVAAAQESEFGPLKTGKNRPLRNNNRMTVSHQPFVYQ